MKDQEALLLTAIPSKRVVQQHDFYDNVPHEDQELFAMMNDVERKSYLETLARGEEGGGGEGGGGDQAVGIPGSAAPLKRGGTYKGRQPQRSKKSRIMAGEKVGGDISHLESFLHEAGCLPGKEAEKKFSSTRAFSDDSDFDVEEEFPSRRGAAKPTPGRGRGGRGGGRNSKGTSAVKPVQPKKVRPVAEVKKNVTTRPFIEASGKPVCEDTQSEEGEGDSGDSTQSENEGTKGGAKGRQGGG